MIENREPPKPGDAHPAYSPEDVATIRYWLDELPEPHLVLPASGTAAYVCSCETAYETVGQPRTRVLASMEAVTSAPWAGRRFMYRYAVAVDDLGRMVVSEYVERWFEPLDATNRALMTIMGRLS